MVFLLHKVIPPLWVGNGAMSLAAGHPLPAVLGIAGTFALGALGLGGAYRSTRRFYVGRGTVPRAKRKRSGRVRTTHPSTVGAERCVVRTLLERTLPGVPEEAAALALATFRSLTRATEVKMALASTIPMVLLYAGMMLFSSAPNPTGETQLLYATGIALFPFLGLLQILNNQFGFDRSGFRTLVLSPTPRWQILLGKNLALLPLALGLGLIYMVLAGVLRHTPPPVLLAALVQLLSAFLLLSLYGSLLSICAPMRVATGSLKPTKVSTARTLFLMLSFFLLPVVAFPILLPAVGAMLLRARSGPPSAALLLLFSVVELVILAPLYPFGLRRLGAACSAAKRTFSRSSRRKWSRTHIGTTRLECFLDPCPFGFAQGGLCIRGQVSQAPDPNSRARLCHSCKGRNPGTFGVVSCHIREAAAEDAVHRSATLLCASSHRLAAKARLSAAVYVGCCAGAVVS